MTQNKFTTNNNPTLVAVSNVDGETPVYLYADPTTHSLLTDIAVTVTPDVNLAKVGGATFSLDQQLAASSLPVVLTAAQLNVLTPPTAVALNPGVNAVGTVGTTPAIVNVGQKASNITAVQLSAASTVPTNGIIVQAISTNTASVFIGGLGVLTSTGYELQAGQAAPFTANLNTLYVIGTNGTDRVCWTVD